MNEKDSMQKENFGKKTLVKLGLGAATLVTLLNGISNYGNSLEQVEDEDIIRYYQNLDENSREKILEYLNIKSISEVLRLIEEAEKYYLTLDKEDVIKYGSEGLNIYYEQKPFFSKEEMDKILSLINNPEEVAKLINESMKIEDPYEAYYPTEKALEASRKLGIIKFAAKEYLTAPEKIECINEMLDLMLITERVGPENVKDFVVVQNSEESYWVMSKNIAKQIEGRLILEIQEMEELGMMEVEKIPSDIKVKISNLKSQKGVLSESKYYQLYREIIEAFNNFIATKAGELTSTKQNIIKR